MDGQPGSSQEVDFCIRSRWCLALQPYLEYMVQSHHHLDSETIPAVGLKAAKHSANMPEMACMDALGLEKADILVAEETSDIGSWSFIKQHQDTLYW